MSYTSILARIEDNLSSSEPFAIEIHDADLSALTQKEARDLSLKYHGDVLITLPESEQAYFDWVKKEDPAVWDDLWGEGELYTVGISFLEQLLDAGNGFRICDLQKVDNYFFTSRHIKQPEGWEYLETVIEKIRGGESISPSDALLFTISIEDIDIWRFSHRHDIPVATAKSLVADLVREHLLVHLTDSEDLVKYIDF